MGEATESYPKDLLQRFSFENMNLNLNLNLRHKESQPEDSIELNLGLSMGGRFGIDPKDQRLSRSSSIGGLAILPEFGDSAGDSYSPAIYSSALTRTCSLPEENLRKRKEMQTLRRMEAKRKRSGKQNFRVRVKDRESLEGNCEEDKKGEEEGLVKEKGFDGGVMNGFRPFGGISFLCDRRVGIDLVNGKSCNLGFLPSSQGSVGSQGSSSSGFSDLESPSVQGLSGCTDSRSPVSVQSLPEQQKAAAVAGEVVENLCKKVKIENLCKKVKIENGGVEVEMGRNVMEEMPCVSTRGLGPNGKKIEGFLYKYRNGEEVRIVCVCHGSFLSPAEFVKHAGGGDVAHPLRHIVVTPSLSSCSSLF
ncbi:ABI five binding protein 3 [Tasmannia lanceolata]|uniref:ABI five binding protein 3 n=1 Tax=Tasmannia lanceolata TaxID=3420 RepID=UPI0040634964